MLEGNSIGKGRGNGGEAGKRKKDTYTIIMDGGGWTIPVIPPIVAS